MAYGGSTGQKNFISADILTKNAQIDIDKYTVSGEGLFDELMETATKHLQVQFDANRIRQEDYAQAYIDIYKATLTAALQAWDTSLKDDENEAKLALLEAQKELTLAQAETERQKPAQIVAQTALTNAQTATQECQKDLVCTQAEEEAYKYEFILPAQKDEILKRNDHVKAQTDLLNVQKAGEVYKNENILTKQADQLTKQIAHLEAQTAETESKTTLTDQQYETEVCRTRLTCSQADEEAYKVTDILPAQKAQIEAQTEYTTQQKVTSSAQEKLYLRQIEGFDENYKEKVMKMALESWSMGFANSKDAFYAVNDTNKAIPTPMTMAEVNRVWTMILKDVDSETKDSATGGPPTGATTK